MASVVSNIDGVPPRIRLFGRIYAACAASGQYQDKPYEEIDNLMGILKIPCVLSLAFLNTFASSVLRMSLLPTWLSHVRLDLIFTPERGSGLGLLEGVPLNILSRLYLQV